jgi:alginate O-acetyltransferase complex protein AlgI
MIQSGAFWLILAVAVPTYWALAPRLRLAFLAIVSAAYLAVLAPFSAASFLFWTIVFFFAAPLAALEQKVCIENNEAEEVISAEANGGAGTAIRKRVAHARTIVTRTHPRVLPVLILSILVYLLAFKYLPEILQHLGGAGSAAMVVPLGISYFTFKIVHYAIEVARKNVPDHSLWEFLCYLFLFPTISAGPIERFDHFLASRESRWHRSLLIEGAYRIGHGLIKKFIFADMLLLGFYQRALSPTLLGPMHAAHTFELWGLGIASYLFLYLDFAGYCDIAIGVSLLFGLRIMENFDWPILAPSIGAFWKRWHMTLAGWCQSYVYMPVLGWTRSGYLALYATFVAIGLWHAVAMNWLVWGLYHATGITVYQAWLRLKRRRRWTAVDRLPWKYLAVPLTFLFVSAGEIATIAGQHHSYASVCVMAKLLFIKLPPPNP